MRERERERRERERRERGERGRERESSHGSSGLSIWLTDLDYMQLLAHGLPLTTLS